MKTTNMNRRIEDLSEKLTDMTSGNIIQLDLESFSESERLLFKKVSDIDSEYQRSGHSDILLKNAELVSKSTEIILKHITELYCFTVPRAMHCVLPNLDYEIVNYFFKLQYVNFEADLVEGIGNLEKWSKEDQEEFLVDLRKRGPHFFRVPRGLSESDIKTTDESTEEEVEYSAESSTEEETEKTE